MIGIPTLAPSLYSGGILTSQNPRCLPWAEVRHPSPGRRVEPPRMEEDALSSCLGLGPPCLPCELAPRQLVWLQGPEAHLSYLHQGDLEEAIRHSGTQLQEAEQASQQGRTPGSHTLWGPVLSACCLLASLFPFLASGRSLKRASQGPSKGPVAPRFQPPNPGTSPG